MKRGGPSPYLVYQQQAQQQMKCDYVLFAYDKDPSAAPPPQGGPPSYIVVREPLPVKLSHQVFMQMAFGVVKDRLSSTGTSGPTATPKQQDVLALYLFLSQYGHSLNACHRDFTSGASSTAHSRGGGRGQAAGATRGRSSSVPRGGPVRAPPPSSSSAALFSSSRLRFQLLLEYGIDVKPLLDAMPTDARSREQFLRQILPAEMDEGEFLQQLGKPSGMAQECSIM